MFAENLKRLREDEGLSQLQLSKKFNVAKQTVGSWEVGRTTPNFDMLTRIAKYFNVSIDSLLDFDGPSGTCLSSEERNLVDKFRTLKPEQRGVVIDFVGVLNDRKKHDNIPDYTKIDIQPRQSQLAI